mgnify:CR=1 FL=1
MCPVDQNQAGLPEGAHQVFSLRKIHAGFSADAAVHLGQQSGGDLDEVHPPEEGGSGKARQVAHHAAAQGCHPSVRVIPKAIIFSHSRTSCSGHLAASPAGTEQQRT